MVDGPRHPENLGNGSEGLRVTLEIAPSDADALRTLMAIEGTDLKSLVLRALSVYKFIGESLHVYGKKLYLGNPETGEFFEVNLPPNDETHPANPPN